MAGGQGKLKGQCMSFKTQEGELKVAEWPLKRQNVVVPPHLNTTLKGKSNISKMSLNQGQICHLESFNFKNYFQV